MARSRAIPRLAALLALALLTVALAAGVRAGGVPTRLRVAPAVSELEVGEVVTLEVRVEQVSNLYGYQVMLAYDPTLIEIVDSAGQPTDKAQLGDMLPDAIEVDIPGGTGDGRLTVAAINGLPCSPVTGSGTLFTIWVKGLVRGVAAVRIDTDPANTNLAGAEAASIPYTPQDATLYVGVEAPPPGRLYLPAVLRGA